MKESVADRVRRFKENSPRLNVQYQRDVLEHRLSTDGNITPLSSCNSVDDILAVLRARATETLHHHQASTSIDLSEILHEIRTSCSETSQSEEPSLNHERLKVKKLLHRLSLGSSSAGQEEEDPLAVIARIKERLRPEPLVKATTCSTVVNDSVLIQDLDSRQLSAFSNVLAAIVPTQIHKECVGLQTTGIGDLSTVSSPIHTCSWPEPTGGWIRSLPLDPNWQTYIETEVYKTRESIYRRISEGRSHFPNYNSN